MYMEKLRLFPFFHFGTAHRKTAKYYLKGGCVDLRQNAYEIIQKDPFAFTGSFICFRICSDALSGFGY